MFNRKVLEQIKYELTKIKEEQKSQSRRIMDDNDHTCICINKNIERLMETFNTYAAEVWNRLSRIEKKLVLQDRKIDENMIESNGLLTPKVSALVFKAKTEEAPGLMQRNKYRTFDKEALLNKVSVYLQTNKTAKKRSNIISDLSLTKREVQNLNNVLLLGVKRVLIKKLRTGVYKATNVYKIN